MQAFTHILMTRFNLATPGRESGIRNRLGWLAERFDMFEKYCLPSVAEQTDTRLHWIIYFDKDTPREFKDRVERCRSIFPFVPYYTGLFPAEGWSRSINETFTRDTPLLLTTRLDNDDALTRDFSQRLYGAVADAQAEPGIYNFPNGYVMGGGALYGLRHLANPFFSSLSEWTDAPVTAPSIHHLKISDHGPLRQVDGPGTWVQVIHDGNVSNKIRGRRMAPTELKNRVPASVEAQLRPAAPLTVALENALLTPLRNLRDHLLTLRKAKRA